MYYIKKLSLCIFITTISTFGMVACDSNENNKTDTNEPEKTEQVANQDASLEDITAIVTDNLPTDAVVELSNEEAIALEALELADDIE